MPIEKKISFPYSKKDFLEMIQKHILSFLQYRRTKIKQKQKISLFDSLFNLVNAGIPVPQSIAILSLQTRDKNIRLLLDTLRKDISKGVTLQDSMARFDRIFSPFDLYMVRMGELTGKIANSFAIIKKREEDNAEIKGKIIGALIYPSVIVLLSIAMIAGFMLYVIPKVQQMYADARVNLPSLTQHVIDTSALLKEHGTLLIILILACICGLIVFKKHPLTKYHADRLILKIPLFGPLIRKKILTIFSSTLGTLLGNGISIQESLDVSKKSIENAYYEKQVDLIISKIAEGIPLSELMGIKKLAQGKEDPYFPIEFASVVKIGEQTGKLASLLVNISKKYEREINTVVKNLSTIIEPVVIIIVGSIVGTLVMAILLPFFNMVKVM